MSTQMDMVPLIRQTLAWDMLPLNHDYWDVLELVPPSEDAAEGMQKESEQRMKLVEPFIPFVEMYSILIADIMTQVIFKNQSKAIDTSDESQVNLLKQWHEALARQNREILRGAMYPMLGAMIEAGLITKGDAA